MSVILNSPNVVIGHMSGGTININNSATAEQQAKKERPECEDIEPVEEEKDCFPLLTEQCRKEGKVHAVENELRTACKGTAIGLWRAIRANEALGYIAAKHLDSRDVYNAFSAYFGDLPYKERNFRKARNER